MGRCGRALRGLLALGLVLGVVGCGSGGSSSAPVAPQGGRTVASVRGVPETIAVYNSRPVRVAGGGDDYLLILSEPSPAGGTASIQVNGGTTPLPLLPPIEAEERRSRPGRRVAMTGWTGLLDGELGRAATRPVVAPVVGSARRFKAEAGGGGVVTATLREKGRHALIYVDDETEAGALTAADLAELRAKFDDEIYPTDTTRLGPTGDFDRNGGVILLITPAVIEGVNGYFNEEDMVPGQGNDADMLYIAAPQPSEGQTYDLLRHTVQATVAHELAHLISFNHKAAVGGEETWLDEGYGQIAEQLNGFLDSPNSAAAYAEFYLAAPEQYTARQLDFNYEFGHAAAGYLFVRYLTDRFGDGALRGLVRIREKGVANVRQVTGQAYAALQPQFGAALFLAGTGLSADPRYSLPGFNPRADYPGAEVSLEGPRQTTLSAAGGRPQATIAWQRGGLRYVRLTQVPAGGTQLHLSTRDTAVQATFVRIPADLP